MPKFNLNINIGAGHHDVVIETARGVSRIDMTIQGKHQKDAIRELVVDSFAVHSLQKPPYA